MLLTAVNAVYCWLDALFSDVYAERTVEHYLLFLEWYAYSTGLQFCLCRCSWYLEVVSSLLEVNWHTADGNFHRKVRWTVVTGFVDLEHKKTFSV
jgi:hypothetical protein